MLFYDYRVRNVFLKNEYHADLGLAGETSFLSMKKVRNVFQIMTRGRNVFLIRGRNVFQKYEEGAKRLS